MNHWDVSVWDFSEFIEPFKRNFSIYFNNVTEQNLLSNIAYTVYIKQKVL